MPQSIDRKGYFEGKELWISNADVDDLAVKCYAMMLCQK